MKMRGESGPDKRPAAVRIERTTSESVSRRSALRAVAAAGAALAGATLRVPVRAEEAPRCVLTPAQTEGPYFVDERLERADLRRDPADGSVKPGALLALALRVLALDGTACAPLAGAIVDIWHCDAVGVYSDVDDPRFATRGAKFLRGYQVTDGNGRVRFTTIYPGAYPGRAVHIHFKVRTRAAEFTSQLYFDDALTDRVHAQPPYTGSRRTRNARDGLYRAGGKILELDVVPAAQGYAAAYDVGVRRA
jgi:protocatechuate 3,4-dioxygenase beta subunit